MSKKKEEKNPYVNNMSLEDVAFAEATHFYIQVGLEVPIYHGKHTFSKSQAEDLFWQMRESLEAMKEEGDAQDKSDAHFCLQNLRLIPLRIH